MTVTEISDGRGTKKHIYLDGEYSFTVDGDYLLMSGIYVGKEFDADGIDAVISDFNKYRAKKRALDLLSRRSHSAAELKRKLMQKTDEENAELAVQRMTELGFIDDVGFAENYARELLERKHFSVSRIRRELLLKGVGNEIADDVVSKLDCDERDRIRELIESKYMSKMKTEKGRNSLFSLLVRLGYGYSDVRSVMSEYNEIDFYEE